MNNRAIARSLWRIADLYAVDGASPFKVRTLQRAAEEIAVCSFSVAISPEQVGQLAGVGTSTVALVKQLVEQGPETVIERLPLSVPSSISELLAVRGLGPKTARQLYEQAGIRSIADLKRALEGGELRRVSGFGAKRVERIRQEVAQIERSEQTIPIALAWPAASALAETLAKLPGVIDAQVTGAARRLVTQVERIECVVGMHDLEPLQAWASRFDLQGNGGELSADRPLDLIIDDVHRPLSARIYVTAPDQFAIRWMESTGNAVHQEIVERIAAQRGYRWINSVLLGADGESMRCETEESVYDRLGLPYYPPELREGKSLLQNPARLVKLSDIQGDLHMHSTYSDGSESIRGMALAARQLGYKYIAITDHSKSLSIAGGLFPDDVRRQGEEIERVNEELDGITILRGIEVDILSDGTLDLPDDLLRDLDVVIASIHSGMNQSREQITGRIVRAIEHPAVDIVAHVSGRLIGRREPYALDVEQILSAAKQYGVCLELNANPNRLDAREEVLRRAAAVGVDVVVDTDAHAIRELDYMEFGVRMAIRGWLQPTSVLNTMSLEDVYKKLHKWRHRHSAPTPLP